MLCYYLVCAIISLLISTVLWLSESPSPKREINVINWEDGFAQILWELIARIMHFKWTYLRATFPSQAVVVVGILYTTILMMIPHQQIRSEIVECMWSREVREMLLWRLSPVATHKQRRERRLRPFGDRVLAAAWWRDETDYGSQS